MLSRAFLDVQHLFPRAMVTTASTNTPFERRLIEVALRLRVAAESLFSAFTRPVRSPADLTASVGLTKDVAHRVHAALAKQDSLALLHAMPGPEALHAIGRLAQGRVADVSALNIWVRAVEEFASFLNDEVGGKHALDAIASAWLPEARAKFEMANRQSACKAAANLRGAISDVAIQTCLLLPNSSGASVDKIYVSGFIRLRRLRPGLAISVANRTSPRESGPEATGSRPPDSDFDRPMLLDHFCSKPVPSIHVTEAGGYSISRIVGNSVGAAAVCDLFLCDSTAAAYARWADGPGELTGPGIRLDVPAKRLIFDVLVHQEVWKDIQPELRVYDIPLEGAAERNDPWYQRYRLDVLDGLRSLGRGILPCRVAQAAAYLNVLRHVCDSRGLDPESLRCYRCDSTYPLFGVQYYMAFAVPERPVHHRCAVAPARGT